MKSVCVTDSQCFAQNVAIVSKCGDWRLNNTVKELNQSEMAVVNGAILANIGMGLAGAASQMGTYAFGGGASGNLSLNGFIGAATSGFIWGAGGFNHLSLIT